MTNIAIYIINNELWYHCSINYSSVGLFLAAQEQRVGAASPQHDFASPLLKGGIEWARGEVVGPHTLAEGGQRPVLEQKKCYFPLVTELESTSN